jgi:hypothetical protein
MINLPSLKKIFIFLMILNIVLVLGHLPYVNVLFLDKLGFFLLGTLLFLIFPISWKLILVLGVLVAFLAVFFTFLKLQFLAELMGVGVYLFSWLLLFVKIKEYLKNLKKT